jgi:hypothetical protein
VDFRDAFARLNSDTSLAEKFIDDPEGILSIMGVDTSELLIQPVVGSKQPFTAVSEFRRRGKVDEVAELTICASIGFIVCASVGGNVGVIGGDLDVLGGNLSTRMESATEQHR